MTLPLPLTEQAGTDHWAASLPLPRAFDVLVRHKALNEVVQQFAVEGHSSSRYEAPLERAQLLVGETYTVRVGVSGTLQLAGAVAEVSQLVEGKTVHFRDVLPSGAEDAAQGVQASWSVEYSGDEAKRAMNSAVLDGVARILQRHPGVRMRLHSETGHADKAPEPLARHYGKHAKRDVQVLCDRLAENRALALMDALIARGVERSRLYTTYKSRTGSARTDFIAQPPEAKEAESASWDFASGVVAALGEFTVQPERGGEPTQQVSIVLAYATGELKVVLRNPQARAAAATWPSPRRQAWLSTLSPAPALTLRLRLRPHAIPLARSRPARLAQAGSGHWSGWLPMANGVPLRVRHVGLGVDKDLISAEVHDGEVVLGGADALFVGQAWLGSGLGLG